MSRNSSGTYSLPAGNPVVPGTVISSSWANTTLSDIANALTDSLSRTGQGGMQAPLALDDGTVALPALTWATEQTTGLYRAGAGDVRYSIGATDILSLTATLFNVVPQTTFSFAGSNANPTILVSNASPTIIINETDAAVDNRKWKQEVDGERFLFSALNDANSVNTVWMQVDRTGTTIDTVNFPNGTLQYGGVEVGLRPVPRIDMTTSRGTASSDRGSLILFLGAGGQTLTVSSGLAQGTTIMIQAYTNAITIAPGGGVTLNWVGGAGSMPTGSRTLAAGGIATIWYVGTSEANVWGIGLT